MIISRTHRTDQSENATTERRGDRPASRATRAVVFPVVLGACAVAGCGSGESEDAIGKSSSSIISGQVDYAHPATVTVAFKAPFGFKLCSGTIIKVDEATGTGIVLTAAHCGYVTGGTGEARPFRVVIGDDYASMSSATGYDVTGWEAYPDDLGDTSAPYHQILDVGVVTFKGATAQTPVMPLRTSTVPPAAGQPATLVGFGTGLNQQSNSRRLALNVNVESASTFSTRTISPSGGSCYGDSGGSLVMDEGGTKVLAGVISTGDAACTGINGRTTSVNVFSPQVSQWLAKFGVASAPPAPAASCALPWGGTIASDASVVAYAAPYGSKATQCSAKSETRVCRNGILSGSYTSQSCNNYPCESHEAYFSQDTLAFPSSTYGAGRPDGAICGAEGKWAPIAADGPIGGCEFWGYYVNSGTCAVYQGTAYECVNTSWTVAPPSACPTF
jgi:hypothetical protein